jgi:CubicO group peptidase (beta-lactamase class C family)
MVRHPLAHAPGERALYTDWNMVLLQLVIERITGQTLDRFLASRLFEPLGMRDTQYNPPAALKPRIAPTEIEDFRGGQVWGEVHDETAWVLGGVSGNAGLFSSARDLAVFAQMLLNGGVYGTTRFLRPETIARWTARQRPDASRALGWDTPSPGSSAGRYFSARSFGHTGFTGTSIWIDPEKGLFVVLLTNRVNPTRDNQKIGPLRRVVADAVQEAIVDAPLTVWEQAR